MLDAIIVFIVLGSWIITLLGWIELFLELIISVIKKQFRLKEALLGFGCLTILSLVIFWLGIQALS